MWNNSLRELWNIAPVGRNVKWNSPPHICEANISQRSYFTWRSQISLAVRRISLKKALAEASAFFWLPLLDLNQRLPVITQLSSRRSANCASLPSPQASRSKHCGQPPFGLLPVKYKKPLFEFNRKNQNEKGHALRDLFRFGSPCWTWTNDSL